MKTKTSYLRPRITALTYCLLSALMYSPDPMLAQEEAPVLVALAIDTSGSIRDQALARTRVLANQLLIDLPAHSEIAIFSFNDYSELVLESTALPERVERVLDSLVIRGNNTVLYDALYDASTYLENKHMSRRALVAITDGKDVNSAVEVGDALAAAQRAGIPIFTLGVGQVKEQPLKRIARVTQGEYLLLADGDRVDGLAGAVLRAVRDQEVAAPPTAQPVEPAEVVTENSTEEAQTTVTEEPSDSPTNPLLWLTAAAIALVLVALTFILYQLWQSQRTICPRCGNRRPSAPGLPCPHCQDIGTATVAPVERETTAGQPPPPPPRTDVRVPEHGPTASDIARTRLLRATGATLKITEGIGVGNSYQLDLHRSNILGRGATSTLQLIDDSVSREHCRIDYRKPVFVLEDLDSANGTFRNGEPVKELTPLEDNDTIRLAETTLQFRLESD